MASKTLLKRLVYGFLIVSLWLMNSSFAANPFQRHEYPAFKIELDVPDLERLLRQALESQRDNNEELKRLSGISKVARFEARLLRELLQAEGYYDAVVRYKVKSLTIVYLIGPGKRYTIDKLDIEAKSPVEILPDVLGLKRGQPLRAADILAAKDALTAHLLKNYCLFEVNVDYEVILDSSKSVAYVTFSIMDSPNVSLGNISFTGQSTIEESFLLSHLQLVSGDCFKRKSVDTARLALMKTNLLSSVTADIAQPEDGKVDIDFQLIERKHRTISIGAGYQSDERFALVTNWTHRNLLGQAERLQVRSRFSKITKKVGSVFSLPFFRDRKQLLVLYTEVENRNTDAFEAETINLGIGLSRQMRPSLRASLGLDLAMSEVIDKKTQEVEDYALLSFPLRLEWDKRDDPLDAKNGWAAALQLRPYWDVYTMSTSFIKSTASVSTFLTVEDFAWQPTLALRGAMGTIDGEETVNVPINTRFFVGGGGSVRGYAFQSLGPLDGETPQGGLSFAEFSVETRFRWTDSFGGVFFIDGGWAYKDRLPKLDQSIRFTAGLGLRYFTSFAPLRLDIGVPLDPRPDIDEDFQLYISIGQAF